jgi:hypothetical protein
MTRPSSFRGTENVRGVRDRPQPPERLLLIGRTDGRRTLTLVIEETLDPETWLIITGWDSRPRNVGSLGSAHDRAAPPD